MSNIITSFDQLFEGPAVLGKQLEIRWFHNELTIASKSKPKKNATHNTITPFSHHSGGCYIRANLPFLRRCLSYIPKSRMVVIRQKLSMTNGHGLSQKKKPRLKPSSTTTNDQINIDLLQSIFYSKLNKTKNASFCNNYGSQQSSSSISLSSHSDEPTNDGSCTSNSYDADFSQSNTTNTKKEIIVDEKIELVFNKTFPPYRPIEGREWKVPDQPKSAFALFYNAKVEFIRKKISSPISNTISSNHESTKLPSPSSQDAINASCENTKLQNILNDMWKNCLPSERMYWEREQIWDRQRYLYELSIYNKAKKDYSELKCSNTLKSSFQQRQPSPPPLSHQTSTTTQVGKTIDQHQQQDLNRRVLNVSSSNEKKRKFVQSSSNLIDIDCDLKNGIHDISTISSCTLPTTTNTYPNTTPTATTSSDSLKNNTLFFNNNIDIPNFRMKKFLNKRPKVFYYYLYTNNDSSVNKLDINNHNIDYEKNENVDTAVSIIKSPKSQDILVQVENRHDYRCPLCFFNGASKVGIFLHCALTHGTDLIFDGGVDEDSCLHISVKSIPRINVHRNNSKSAPSSNSHLYNFVMISSKQRRQAPRLPFLPKPFTSTKYLDVTTRKKKIRILESNPNIHPDAISQYTLSYDFPIRQYYHSKSLLPMEDGDWDFDSDLDCDDVWVNELCDKELDEFLDLAMPEKQFMKLWNAYIKSFVVIADQNMPCICLNFVRKHHAEVRAMDIRDQLFLHLLNLWDCQIVSSSHILTLMQMYDTLSATDENIE